MAEVLHETIKIAKNDIFTNDVARLSIYVRKRPQIGPRYQHTVPSMAQVR